MVYLGDFSILLLTFSSHLVLNSFLQLLASSCVALSGKGHWHFRRYKSVKECGMVTQEEMTHSHGHCVGKTS